MTGMYNNSNSELHNILDSNALENKNSEIVFTDKRVEPQNPGEYEPFIIYFNFKNKGNTEIKKFRIRMVTTCQDDESLGVDQAYQQVSPLKEGATGETSLSFSYGMPAGNYVIEASLDCHNQVTEYDEDIEYGHTAYDVVVG